MSFDSIASLQQKYQREISKINEINISIFFVGMMGCGKTTLGNIVSKTLQCNFIEMDLELERKLGMTVKEIFQQHGEEFFRTHEKHLLKEICQEKNDVISCGGGVYCDNDNIKQINNSGISIFLNVSSKVLEQRLSGDQKRPLLHKKPVNNLLLQRISYYTQSHIMVDLNEGNIDDNIGQIITELYKYIIRNE